ncbi:MAG: FAD-binding and (Fe-S)-binding domain-containing protein, partial [Bacteroidota bacterium]
MSVTIDLLNDLRNKLEGDIFTDESSLLMYATDASAYREKPLAVIRPKQEEDIRKIILFAGENKIPLIPRTAGTSLAGQVVGNGIVVDVSRYMTGIIELNVLEKWVRVQPGVVLDELNKYLAPHKLFFGPETSTSSRCMIGGMVGNNSCGAHSILYGSTRDHTLAVKAILSDGSEADFHAISSHSFIEKCQGDTLENRLYRHIKYILNDPFNHKEIREQYPDPAIKRRNTGYAIDLLLDCEPFTPDGEAFNMCRLIAGSEGTLAFITEIKLNLVPLPPPVKGLVCIHMETLEQALHGNLVALKYSPGSVELMDDVILELTKDNIEQQKNRFFVEGRPGAILIVEFAGNTREEIEAIAEKMEKEMRAAGYGYHFPLVFGQDIKKVWDLRKAGLGVLSNMPGDSKPVPVTEDTAVSPAVLPAYIKEFQQILDELGLKCVYYAHIATGELHLRPVLNLKDPADVVRFRQVAEKTALLVKKYRGSLSGEHGDGRLRGEFIPLMIGERNYKLLEEIKKTWDPDGIFNPGKITGTPPMNTSLRYEPGKETREIHTIFDFSGDSGIMRSVEKCNGSGDCRKSAIMGGTMCPSYMASRNESQATRARANILREFLTNSEKENPFDHKEIYDIMDLCLSCKACKSECPSSVDMAKLKAEFLQHYYDANGIPLRTKAIAYLPRLNKMGKLFRPVTNAITGRKFVKKWLGFTTERSIPHIQKGNVAKAAGTLKEKGGKNGKVYLFLDEFTRFNDTAIGIKTVILLNRLGYEVVIPGHKESGRTFLSKGLVRTAKKIAETNVAMLKDLITGKTPLIGIEPSAILAFRDEYPELVGKELKEAALFIAQHTMMIDEFLASEAGRHRIVSEQFTSEKKEIKLQVRHDRQG